MEHIGGGGEETEGMITHGKIQREFSRTLRKNAATCGILIVYRVKRESSEVGPLIDFKAGNRRFRRFALELRKKRRSTDRKPIPSAPFAEEFNFGIETTSTG